MKLSSTPLLFLCFAIAVITYSPQHAAAQGNLQFNRVVLVSSVQTLPSGKVWKVEAALLNGNVAPYAASGTHMATNTSYITVNGNSIAVKSAYTAYGTPAQTWSGVSVGGMDNTSDFPFWLPAGATLAASTNVTYLSVMEFNVIP